MREGFCFWVEFSFEIDIRGRIISVRIQFRINVINMFDRMLSRSVLWKRGSFQLVNSFQFFLYLSLCQ